MLYTMETFIRHAILLKSQSIFSMGSHRETLYLENLENVFEHSFSQVQVKAGDKKFLLT